MYPWSACGQVEKLMKESAEKWLGEYRNDLEGVPIAIGPIQLKNDIYIQGSQPVVHIDANISAVIFKPSEEQLYPCTVTLTQHDYFVGKVYNCLSVIVKCKNDRVLPKSIKVGDEVNFKYTGKSIKEGEICQLKGVYDPSYQ
uniref:Uncharacterized protein n=1 Tax=Acrobeloides nanus TaxID=290746 RepID=A0A914E1X5_9BILA